MQCNACESLAFVITLQKLTMRKGSWWGRGAEQREVMHIRATLQHGTPW